MAKQIEVSAWTVPATFLAIARAHMRMRPEDHHDECPVRHGASADCVWPLAVCVPDDWTDPAASAAAEKRGG
jgi:hypothetical protein